MCRGEEGRREGGRPQAGGRAGRGQASAAREERRRRKLYPARRCPKSSPRRSNVASPSPGPEPRLRMPRRF